MSWLPDPSKFLRRSYRKGDGDNPEKTAKGKSSKSNGGLKHSSLYSLMRASSSNSIDNTAEDDNRSSNGALESSTSNAESNPSHLHAVSNSTDASWGQSRSDLGHDLTLIREAANILISNVPSSNVHAHEGASHAINEDAVRASPHASRASKEADKRNALSNVLKGNRDNAYHLHHPHDSSDFDASDQLARGETKTTGIIEVTNEGQAEIEQHISDEDTKTEETSSPFARQDGQIDVEGKDLSSALPANSDNDQDTDESECKVISEDPAALIKASQDGKMNSPSSSVAKERRKGKGSSRKPSKRRNLVDHWSKRKPNTRESTLPEKDIHPSHRKSSTKKNRHSEQRKESLKVEKDREAMNNENGQLIPRDNDRSSFSDKASTSVEGSLANELSDRETANYSYMREPTFNHRFGGPRVAKQEYTLMPQESFAFQGTEGIGETARRSVGRDGPDRNATRRSPTLSAGRRETIPASMQHEAFQAEQGNEMMEDRARTSIGHDTPKLNSRKSHSMVSSPFMLRYQDEEIEDRGRVSIGHKSTELIDMRRGPYATRRAVHSPSMSPIHQAFSLQEDEVPRERARRSVGHDHTDLATRRHSPRMEARDLLAPSTPRNQNSAAQVSDIMGERARMSVGYDAPEPGSWKRSPMILSKELNSLMSPRHTFSLQDSEIMVEGARVSMGRDAPESGSRRRSPYMSGRRELNSPLLHHHYLLQEREERARISIGHDEWDIGSRRQSPYMAGRRDQSLLPMMSSQRFYLQEDDIMSVYDMPASPFSASQASLLLERGGSMFGDKPVSPLPTSPQFFSQSTEQYYQSLSPVVSSKHFISQEVRQSYKRPSSPYYGVLPLEGGRAYSGEATSPMPSRQGFHIQRDVQRSYMDDELVEPENPRASSYYQEPTGRYMGRGDDNSPRTDALDFPVLLDEEAFSEEPEEHNELSESSLSRRERSIMMGSHDEVAMVQQFLREHRELQLLQEEEGHRFLQHEDAWSQSSRKAHLISKQRSNASSRTAGTFSMMSPRSATGSSVSSEKRVMKRLKAAQAKVAEVRRARRRFEEMVVQMVGSGGEDAVQDLLDLEEFVGSYESLTGGGLFKGVVDQFFHELCCELLQPVSQENDSVLSMALFRLEQMNRSL